MIDKIRRRILCKLIQSNDKYVYDLIESIFSVYKRGVQRETKQTYEEPETWFKTSDGKNIPVFSNYRYSIKKGWNYFRQFDFLARLDRKGLLDKKEKDYFLSSIGSRTLTRPLSEVDSFIDELISKKDIPLLSKKSGRTPVLQPEDSDIHYQIKLNCQANKKLFALLKDINVLEIKNNASILEIGYLSGGYSIIAFEKLGFKAMGIDNCYDGLADSNPLIEHNSRIACSKAIFLRGDITARTQIDNDSLDLIYSTSVLEHILNLPAAFREMHRILRPGGTMIHSYHPFFCESGGHSLAIPDSPWAHVRMNRQEYSRYIETLRPYESSTAVDWLNKGLNPCPAGWMQKYISEAGFIIQFWRGSSGGRMKNYPDPDIVSECMDTYPSISMEDLLKGNILVVARKI